MNEKDIVFYPISGNESVIKRKNALLKKLNYECETKEARRAVLSELFGHVGKNASVTPLFYCDYGFNISVGDNFYSNYNFTVLDCAKVTIGDNAFIGPNVGIYAVGHAIDPELRRRGAEFGLPITIGNDVWIGGHTVINPGVTIGNNVVIGSGSVVTRDIPDNVVAAGNPCRVLRSITDDDKKYFFKKLEYPPEYIKMILDGDKE